MAFDWLHFLHLAQTLASKGDEASKRTAISRAYYSAYHLANARAIANCGPPSAANKHAWCWGRYANSTDQKCVALGIVGDRLKKSRHYADYESASILRLEDVCKRALLDAQEFRADFMELDARLPSR